MLTAFLMISLSIAFIQILFLIPVPLNWWTFFVALTGGLAVGKIIGIYLKKRRLQNPNIYSTKLHWVTSVVFTIIGMAGILFLIIFIFPRFATAVSHGEMELAFMGTLYFFVLFFGLAISVPLFLSGLSGIYKARKKDN